MVCSKDITEDKNNKISKEEILSEMERLYRLYKRARSLTTSLELKPKEKDLRGEYDAVLYFATASFYEQDGYNGIVVIPIAKEKQRDFQSDWSDMGHWINESFLIRLWALFEQDKIIITKKSNKERTFIINECELMDKDKKYIALLWNLRCVFAHSDYHLNIKKYKSLCNYNSAKELMHDLYGSSIDAKGRFNLSIKDFIKPLYDEIREIIKKHYRDDC